MGRWALALAASLALARGDDKIGKMKAPEALRKSAAEHHKRKGYHVEMSVGSTIPDPRPGEKPAWEGKVVRDFAALKGPLDVYARGTMVLVKNRDGQFVEPENLSVSDNRVAAPVRNPAVLLSELHEFAPAAQFVGDGKIGELDCRIAETHADERSLGEQIREVSSRLRSVRRFLIRDLTGLVDRKRSTSVYKGWVNKEDLLVARIEWTLTMVMDKKAIPIGADRVPDQIEVSATLTLSKFDTDLEVEIPPEVRKAFRMN